MHIFVGSYFMGSYRLRNLLELKSAKDLYVVFRCSSDDHHTRPMNRAMPAEERNAFIFERLIRIKVFIQRAAV